MLNAGEISGMSFLSEGMNVPPWIIGQGEWSTVGQCEEAKRGGL